MLGTRAGELQRVGLSLAVIGRARRNLAADSRVQVGACVAVADPVD